LANFNKKVTPWILSLIIKELSSELETNFDPLELLQKTVKIATRILKEYFENIGSPRLLRLLSDIIKITEGCLGKTD
jgi:hypothetical protein